MFLVGKANVNRKREKENLSFAPHTHIYNHLRVAVSARPYTGNADPPAGEMFANIKVTTSELAGGVLRMATGRVG